MSEGEKNKTTCCIVGGGPAGLMAGFLLARSGIDVIVLEKHSDFLRDFRGDTIHPSTLQALHELGLLEKLLSRPHQKAKQLHGVIGGVIAEIADFSHLSTECKFIVFMPQWEFLNFLVSEAEHYPTFDLRMETEVAGLLEEKGKITGVKIVTCEGQEMEIHADLVIGADGRYSTVREKAGLKVHDYGAPMDVMWFRLSRKATEPEEPMGWFSDGSILITLNRGDYWQCGFVVPKGAYSEVRAKGLGHFRAKVSQLVPFFQDRMEEIQSWDDIRLLTVKVDRLLKWYRDGLLCIGDAAHAMSPVGGVGINLAIQDAIATANILTPALRKNQISVDLLRRVQARRELPTRITQGLQIFVQRKVIHPVLNRNTGLNLPLSIRLLRKFPRLQGIPAYLIGVGVRPELAAPTTVSSFDEAS